MATQAETANLNQRLNEKLLESTDGFHEDQQQLQVRVLCTSPACTCTCTSDSSPVVFMSHKAHGTWECEV